jgi:TP901 family phage tail tape measure protein
MADKIVGVYDIKVDAALKNLNKLEKEVTDVGKTSSKSAKQTEQAYTKLSKNLGNSFKNLGRQLAGAFAIGGSVMLLKNALTGIINTTRDFEFQMARVKAITGATSEEFKRLSDDAKRLGSSTKFTATQVAELQEEYAKLGFNTSEILNATEATLTLAEATGSNLAESANVAGAVLRAFGLDASETQRVVDVMALSFSSSALNMTDFAEAMKFVAPIARAANIPIETTTALLGKLADSGLRGSIAGTGLKNLLSKLSDENSKLAKELGFSVKNSDDLFKAFQQLQKGHIDLSKATELTDERSKAAFLTLINGIDAVEDLDAALNNAAGSADNMSGVMRDTLKGDIDRLNSAIEGLALALGEGEGGLAMVVRLAVSNWTDYINIIAEAALSTEQLIKLDAVKRFHELKESVKGSEESIDDLIKRYREAIIAETEYYGVLLRRYGFDEERQRTEMAAIQGMQMFVKFLEEKRDAQKKDSEETDDSNKKTEVYTRSIEQLNKELKDLKDEFKKAEIGSDDWNNKVIEISKKTSELEAATRKATAQLVMFQQAARGFDPFAVDEFDDRSSEGIGLDFKDIESEIDDISDKITEPIDLYAESVANGTDIADDLWQQHFNNVMFMQDQTAENDKKNKEEQEARFYDFYNASMDLFANLSQLQRNLNEEELNNLAAQLERGEITREEYDRKRKQIMIEQAETTKAMAIFDATVNGASAIVNALNTDPTGILSAIVGASVAAQIAAIASQPLPQFAEGGFINEHGEFVGRKHSQGGVRIEAEGGEFITAAKYAQPNKDILKAINSGSWEKYKVENIIAPAIEQVLEGGLQGLGASYSLQNNFNDRNLLKAIDRHRNSDKDGFMYLAKELKRMNPRKRGGFA